MGIIKSGKSILRPFDGVTFDTPENQVRFAGQSGWVTFYTAVKIIAALFLFTVLALETLSRFQREDNVYFQWPDFAMQILIILLVAIVFLAMERTAFSGFRAYLDAQRRVGVLEENLKAASPGPIYLPLHETEKAVPTSRSRFQLFLFVWSKYLFFFVYTIAFGLSVLTFFDRGSAITPPAMFFAVVCGPVIILAFGRWVLQSEKEIRLSFARNGSIDAELKALQARNTELEGNLRGFTGQNEERDADWLNQLRAKDEMIQRNEAELKEVYARVATLQSEQKQDKAAMAKTAHELAGAQDDVRHKDHLCDILQSKLDKVSERLSNVSTEFAKNCTLDEAFSSVKQSLERLKTSETLDADSLTVLSELMRDVRERAPDGFADAKSLSFISAEEQRINQYDAIVRLYSRKIQKLRSSELDEEEQQDAIDAMRRLRDREIAELEGSS